MSNATIHYSKAPSRPPRVRKPTTLRGLVTTLFWCASAIVIIGLLFGAIYFTIPMALAIAPLVVLLLITSAAEAARNVRRQRGMTILGYIEQAVRLNLPLSTMLASAEASERGKVRRRLHDLGGFMQVGLPVHEGLSLSVPEISDRVVALVRSGEVNGSLAQTLDRLMAENRRTDLPDPLNTAFYRAYPLALSLMVVLVLTVFLVFVMPKYETIFRDFNVQLPGITLFVLEFGRTLLAPVMFVLIVTALLVAGGAVERFFVVRPGFQGVMQWLTDRLVWVIPIAGRAARDAGLADVFQTLDDATRNGQPFPRAVEEARALRVNVVLSNRLARWHEALLSGMTPADSARRAKMPTVAVGLLASARAGEDAPAVLGFLARYYRSRYSRTRALVTGAFVPAVVLAMGVCVCAVAMAMLLPLTRLVDHLNSLSVGMKP